MGESGDVVVQARWRGGVGGIPIDGQRVAAEIPPRAPRRLLVPGPGPGQGRRDPHRPARADRGERPPGLHALYALTDAATKAFNALETGSEAAGNEIETTAREEIAEEFRLIATAHGYLDADPERLVSARDW